MARTSPTQRTLAFVVHGRALPAGSKTAVPIMNKAGKRFGNRVIESGTDESRSAKADWRADIRRAAKDAILGDPGWPTAGALEVWFTFTRKRPSGHYGQRKGARYVKDSAPPCPTTRPDVLKLSRAVEDALTGFVWDDDSQIVREHIVKEWGEADLTTVRVVEITRQDLAEPSAPLGS